MGTLQPFQDSTGKMSQEQINAENIKLLMQEFNRSQIVGAQLYTTETAEIANDGVTNRVVFGYATGLAQWGLFVSKSGFDALNDTNPANFIFISGS